MTELQRAVLADLLLHGPSTGRTIAERTGQKERAVLTCLTWLRGEGWVSDGSTSAAVGDQLGFAWSPGRKPTTWTFIEKPEQNSAVYHGVPYPRRAA